MKIISIDPGRVVQLWVPEEMRIQKPLYAGDVIDRVKSHFGFVYLFTTELPEGGNVPPGSLIFRQGRVILDGEQITVFELGVHNDGLVVVAPTTEEASKVADYALEWAIANLGGRTPTTAIPRSHHSAVIVEFDQNIDTAMKSFEKLGAIVSKAWQESYQVEAAFNLGRLSVLTDETVSSIRFNTEFVIERRKGVPVPHSSNRYYCSASLPTAKHIEVLEQLEELFNGRGG